jgi:hypothetical protein
VLNIAIKLFAHLIMSELLPPVPNPHLLEQRFWRLPPSCFHWDRAHAAANLLERGVRSLSSCFVSKGSTGLIVLDILSEQFFG